MRKIIVARAAMEGGPSMVELEKPGFDTAAFLASAGLGRRIIQLAPKEAFFTQGDPADSVFYLQEGRAKVTVSPHPGKKLPSRFLFDREPDSASIVVGCADAILGCSGP